LGEGGGRRECKKPTETNRKPQIQGQNISGKTKKIGSNA
jgi:hypothetical protein